MLFIGNNSRQYFGIHLVKTSQLRDRFSFARQCSVISSGSLLMNGVRFKKVEGRILAVSTKLAMPLKGSVHRK